MLYVTLMLFGYFDHLYECKGTRMRARRAPIVFMSHVTFTHVTHICHACCRCGTQYATLYDTVYATLYGTLNATLYDTLYATHMYSHGCIVIHDTVYDAHTVMDA